MLSKSRITGDKGFTLIEIIITLVAAGVLAIFYIHFMGTAMDFSWKSVELVAGEAKAEGLMEKIIAEYVREVNTNPDAALAAIVGQEATYESDPDFGTPVTMQYITYDSSGNEAPSVGTSNNLKVIVEAPGNDFTTILTKSRNDADNPIVYY